MDHVDPSVLHEVTSQDAYHLDHVALQNLEVQEGLRIDVVVHMEAHQGLAPLDLPGPLHFQAPSYY